MASNWIYQWLKYSKDLYSYEERLKRYDVVLPPIMPASLLTLASANSNWNNEVMKVESYVDKILAAGGIKRKVFNVVIDTGAKSKSKYLQKNFIDLGKDHTTDGNPIDENFHFSHVLSSIIGNHPDGRMGLLNNPRLPNDWYLATGEKVLTRAGNGTYTQIANGMEHALSISKPYLNNGWAVVWNCSFGGYGSDKRVSDIMAEATRLGVIIVCAAGNSGNQGVNFPGTDYNAVTIGAIDQNGAIASFSSVGKRVDMACGGVNVWGADNTETGTRFSSGTSMASPNQAALIGLILGANPDIKNRDQLLAYINANITDAGTPGEDDYYGLGISYLHKYNVAKGSPIPNPDPPKPDPIPDPEPPKDIVKPLSSHTFVLPDEYTISYITGSLKGSVKVRLEVMATSTLMSNVLYQKILDTTNLYMTNRGYGFWPDVDWREIGYWVSHFYQMLMKKNYGVEVTVTKITVENKYVKENPIATSGVNNLSIATTFEME